MLSFLQGTCEQLSSEALQDACEWGTGNPAIALGVAAGATVLTLGGLFWSRNHYSSVQSQPIVPRLQPRTHRESLRAVIASTKVDEDTVQEITAMATAEKMPIQTIVTAYLQQEGARKQYNSTQMRNWVFEQNGQPIVIGKPITQAEIDTGVLRLLGLPTDGKVPTLLEQRRKYNEALERLGLSHCQVAIAQKHKIS